MQGDANETGSEDGEDFGSEDDSRRSVSPSKLTARQRAKYDKDLQDTLLSLPGTFTSSLLYPIPITHYPLPRTPTRPTLDLSMP